MEEEKYYRLNKALRELNISLDRAIETLLLKGQKVEARPTTKINQEQYDILQKEFKNNDQRLKIEVKPKSDSNSKNWEHFLKGLKKITFDTNDANIRKTLGGVLTPTISRKQSLSNLSKAYQEEKLVLVLGAGISLEFGVPNWNDLLQKLMVHTIEKEKDVSNILSKLFNQIFKPNPLIAGRYLQEYFDTNTNNSFESMVREILYENIDKNIPSKLLDEIVKMCVAPGRSPNLDSIITYNFDDILEYKLESNGLGIPFKSIYGIGMDHKNDELPIYHVHGYLPEKGNLNNSNTITFGEGNYHQQYVDIYSWNNIVQINKFRENTCLFIGSSLTDPNIRRLLDIALKQRGKSRKHHYIFKKRITKNSIYNDIEMNNEDEKNQTMDLLLKIYESFEENDSSSFGVKTIWIDEWDEIPKILESIRRNAGNK